MLVGITLLTFLLSHAVPADPVTASLGEQAAADPAVVAAFRREWGLDRSLPEQYGIYLWNLVRGNFGVSISTRQPVWLDLRQTFPVTVELAVVAMGLSVLIWIPLGVLSALWRNSLLDHVLRVVTVSGLAIASFWLGIMLQLLFAMRLGWTPLNGRLQGFPPESVTGFYLVGSVALGAYRPGRSDVDFVAVLDVDDGQPLAARDARRLRADGHVLPRHARALLQRRADRSDSRAVGHERRRRDRLLPQVRRRRRWRRDSGLDVPSHSTR